MQTALVATEIEAMKRTSPLVQHRVDILQIAQNLIHQPVFVPMSLYVDLKSTQKCSIRKSTIATSAQLFISLFVRQLLEQLLLFDDLFEHLLSNHRIGFRFRLLLLLSQHFLNAQSIAAEELIGFRKFLKPTLHQFAERRLIFRAQYRIDYIFVLEHLIPDEKANVCVNQSNRS